MMERRGSSAIWGFILVMIALSAIVTWMRLDGLPDLGMLLGPDLTVRQVSVERSSVEGQPFQRGDRLIAIEGMAVEDLRDLRTVLPALVQSGQEEVAVEEGLQAPDGYVFLSYQLWRPEHRFSLAMQGEPIDPTALPPGVEPEDQLVEIDGRLLPGKVGLEGIRSITASRPDALLGLERRNAVFSGQMLIPRPGGYPGVLVVFMLALLMVGALWRWHSESIGEVAAYCIALETLCLVWLFLLAFGFQWLLADSLLATGVIVSLVMMRPLAMLARESAGRKIGRGGLMAMGLGGVTSLSLIGLMVGGHLAGPEEAMQVAGIVAGLFIIYELAASGMEKNPSVGAGDRGGYLIGIVGMAFFATIVIAMREPVAFGEEQWRWFALSLPLLVWFGDILFGFKYGLRSAIGDVAEQGTRRKIIRDYLSEIALELPHTDLRLIAQVDGRAIGLYREEHTLNIGVVSDALADAVDILFHENARIPLPEGTLRGTHPMEGIAAAMNISIALPLMPPPGSLMLGSTEVAIALVGMRELRGDGDLPSYASSETLDLAQELWTGAVASAAKVEILAGIFDSGIPPAPAPGTPVTGGPDLQEELEEAREIVEKTELARVEIEEFLEAEKRVRIHKERRERLRALTLRPLHPALMVDVEFLEQELLDGLDYLLQGPEPIVLGGRLGVGKSFVAMRAHLLEGRNAEDFLSVDFSEPNTAKVIDQILGEIGGGVGTGLLEGFEGSLLIRGAQRCDDSRMLALCHQCEERGVRLFLSFQSDEAEERSVLEGRPPTIQELLSHREIILPRLHRRVLILRPLLSFWMEEWAYRYDKQVDGFARRALEALEFYSYPGEVSEAIEVVRMAVIHAQHDVIDLENLPLEVRQR